MNKRVLTVSLAAVLALAGCTAQPQEAPTPSASASAISLPDTALGAEMAWILGLLNGDAAVADADVAHFSDTFMDAVGGREALEAAITQMRALGPYTVTDFSEQAGAASAVTQTPQGSFLISIVQQDDQLTGFTVTVHEEAPPAATSWDEVGERAAAIDAPARAVVYDVSGDAPEELHAFGDLEGLAPVGSIFKLFVLRAVVDAVAAGDLAWDDTVTVTDALKSLPSGTYQDEPDGTTHTVEEAALAMISVSDNTATDVLIDAVGAGAVEAVMARLGVEGAEANTPLASTRALFQLGWGPLEARDAWAEGDDQARRDLLAQVAAEPVTTQATDLTSPVWDKGLDWFFTAADLATIHTDLSAAADTPEGAPLGAILSTNPGISDAASWDNVQFKGGSSVGVLAGSWLVEKGDKRYVVVIQIATDDMTSTVTPYTLGHLADDITGLLAG